MPGRGVLFLVAALVLALAGCVQPLRSNKNFDNRLAGEHSIIAGDGFQHLIYRHGDWGRSGPVHVYLEGDGLPWVTRTRVARDPTPRNALALRLMASDPAPSLYLGRPCYHGLADSAGCSPWLWTHGRYSEEVVASMAAALTRALGPDRERKAILIGYSGGGVLAMLIAARERRVQGVVTIASNLDIDAWADLHGYSRLRGSLNPAVQPPLPSGIRQVHLAGGRDDRVPARLSHSVADRQPNAAFAVFPEFDHVCCWERDWSSILATLEGRAPRLPPSRERRQKRAGDPTDGAGKRRTLGQEWACRSGSPKTPSGLRRLPFAPCSC